MLNKKFIAVLTACTLAAPVALTSVTNLKAEERVYGNLVEEGFENGLNDWIARGPETVALSSEEAHSGKNSVKVSKRTSTWNGAMCNMTDRLTLGETYTFGVWVKYTGNAYQNSHAFSLQLQYNDGVNDNYKNIKTLSVTKGQWTYIEGSYTIPTDAVDVNIYVESQYNNYPSQEDLMDFYIDDFKATPAHLPDIETNIASLKDVYASYFKIGGAAQASEIASKPAKALFLKHYNSLTFGNELKPDSVLDYDATVRYMKDATHQDGDANPQISLRAARTLLEFARDNQLPVRGHVLVWHNQTPDWFFKENYSTDPNAPWASRKVMLKRMENYIKNVMAALKEQYPTVEFYAWDVVNEAVDANTATGLRNPGSNNVSPGTSAWMQTVGPDFIEKAFEYARKYAPQNCKLFYNDYNEYEPAKMNYIYKILKDLKAKGLVDGMGMQSHWVMEYPSINMFETAVRKYASLGLEIQLTELDIANKDNSEAALKKQAERYKSLMEKVRSLKNEGAPITAVTFWGVTDATSWLGGYPLLFDKNYKAKPAYYGVIDGVTADPVTPSPTPDPTPDPVTPSPTPDPTPDPVTPSPTPDPTPDPVTPSPTPDPTLEPEKPASQAIPIVSVRTNVNGNSVSQRYFVKVKGGAIDISKLQIVYTADGMSLAPQNVWCDNAALQLNISPWYVPLTQIVSGKVENGALNIVINKCEMFEEGTGEFTMDLRFAKTDWSNYGQLSNEKVHVYYDGVEVQ